jgi:hypothetical protein
MQKSTTEYSVPFDFEKEVPMKSNRGFLSLRRLALIVLCLVLILAGFALPSHGANAQEEEPEFTSDFRLEDCRGFKARGVNPYFILRPGYQLVYEGEEDGEELGLVIKVLNETKTIDVPDLGDVKTRVVEERETADGELAEVSRNFFAICNRTNDVVYFGEEVDIYNEDGSITHEGAWLAGQPDEDGVAQPGLIMPGTFLLGSRYYQEIADGIALDRAEHVDMGLEVDVPAGSFDDCVQVIETTPLEPGSESEKMYCPGVGLVIDDVFELVRYGNKGNGNEDEDDGE